MPRGGRRAPIPGKAYSNRSDLNSRAQLTPMAATGQPYGQAGAQLAAQRAVPIASAPPLPEGEPPQWSMPQLPSLSGPSQRPDEPVTHGLPIGPGAGPAALTGLAPMPSANDDVELQLRAVYQAHPTEQLRALIEMLDSGDV